MPVSPELDGHHFFTKVNMKRAATPLLAALVVVEFTDVIFAVDSVPAVLAVSHEPYLVFASNAFAILGLRAAYFLLAGWKDRLHYLGHGLGLILVFVGVKMAVSHWVHFPTPISLGVIVVLLTVAVVASRIRERRLGASSVEASYAHEEFGVAVHRVLDPSPVVSFEAYLAQGGGRGLEARSRARRPRRRSRRCSPPDCAAAVVPGSRPAASGRPSPRTSRPCTRPRWSSTRPRASPVRSRTARCCARTRTRCSKAR